jgi:hypothetical protein
MPFLDELVRGAALVVARSDDGDLVFVGRSLDSMFDLLGAALAGTPAGAGSAAAAVAGLVVGGGARADARRPRDPRPDAVRAHAAPPSGGAGGRRALRRHVREPARRHPRLGGRRARAVGRRATQAAVRGGDDPPPAEPAHRAVVAGPGVDPRAAAAVGGSVSLDRFVWSYLGDVQHKLTPPFLPVSGVPPDRRHDERTRFALAEAVALVEYGRSAEGRRALARAMAGEPALSKPWLRTLVHHLNHVHGRLKRRGPSRERGRHNRRRARSVRPDR